MTDTLRNRIQQLDADAIVALFQLDATSLGGEVLYFANCTDDGSPVTFGGQQYSPIDFDSEGWEWSGKGAFPRPKFRIANTTNILSALLLEFNDLLGATVARIRTLGRFLDGHSDADPSAEFARDVFRIDRVATRNKVFIEFELASAMDVQGRMLPARQITRTCPLIYRAPDGAGGFNYSRATCPYVGVAAFDESGNPVAPALDRCGKQVRDCKLRFGLANLPFGGFPGAARVRAG